VIAPPAVDPAVFVGLVLAGVLGGVVSVLVSLASLVTYPALLAAGLAPVSANVTNTVALVFNAVGAGLGARPELVGQRPTLTRLAVVAGAGGATGAVLLLAFPGEWFELVAPVLIAAASLGILVQPWLQQHARFQPRGITPVTATAYFSTAVYIGYFGAAGGILSLIALSSIIDRPLTDQNAAKAVLSGVANGVAAIGFALFGPVAWEFVVPLACGMFVGGLIGPWLARRLPTMVFRGLIAVCGLGVAGVLAWRTYLA
jgi:uncharacterized membrane protein YfcA